MCSTMAASWAGVKGLGTVNASGSTQRMLPKPPI
jgi:hypothetical protein